MVIKVSGYNVVDIIFSVNHHLGSSKGERQQLIIFCSILWGGGGGMAVCGVILRKCSSLFVDNIYLN